MDKDVLLSIRGLQFGGETDSEKIETIIFGEYYKRGDSHYILYQELLEGEQMPVKNIVKLKDREMELTRRGLVNVHMVFAESRKNMSNYETPFGSILVGIDTKRVCVQEQEQEITVEVDYALEMNYEFVSDCTITMKIRSKSACSHIRLC